MRQGGNLVYTFGYLREATQAHLDLDEQETQAMHLQERYHIFANEAMQAICAVKPNYEYFKCQIVSAYNPVIRLGDNAFREATGSEINWVANGLPQPDFADEIDTKLWYEGQNIYLLNSPVKMPDKFIAFAEKQAWAFSYPTFNTELFIRDNTELFIQDSIIPAPTKTRAGKNHFYFSSRNTLTFIVEGEFWVPYKAIWYKFISGISDDEEIDMPVDIFLTIPLYIAALCLQIDHAQKAQMKRAEFEAALARCSATDFMELKQISPTYR